nr:MULTISPECIES: hypothetical protein [unclassified Brevundimonas]
MHWTRDLVLDPVERVNGDLFNVCLPSRHGQDDAGSVQGVLPVAAASASLQSTMDFDKLIY